MRRKYSSLLYTLFILPFFLASRPAWACSPNQCHGPFGGPGTYSCSGGEGSQNCPTGQTCVASAATGDACGFPLGTIHCSVGFACVPSGGGGDGGNTCSVVGDPCTDSAQCCTGAACLNGRCGQTCRFPGNSCSSSADCCSGSACQNNTCVQTCSSPGASCSSGQPCCNGASCGGDAICHQTCHNVFDSCSTNSDCCAGATCQGNTCVQACIGVYGDCSHGETCCSGAVCNSNGKCGQVCSGLSAQCDSTHPCCSGGTCNADTGTCQRFCSGVGSSCSTSTDCCSGALCNGGKCAVACGQTGNSCSGDADCCSGDVCSNGTCTVACGQTGNGCSADTDCCSGDLCKNGACAVACGQTGNSCGGDADCCSGDTCVSGQCKPACGQTGNACSGNGDCCSGDICASDGKCKPVCGQPYNSCNSDSDCCSGTICGAVDPKDASKGKECKVACEQPFNTCSADSDCCSGSTCNWVDPNDHTRGKGCAVACGLPYTTCSSNSDCCSGSSCNWVDPADQTKGKECKVACEQPFNQCSSDSDCCSGSTCDWADPNDHTIGKGCKLACGVPGSTCASSKDCCFGTTCNFIDDKNPSKGLACKVACAQPFNACQSDGDCCSGTTCNWVDPKDQNKGKECKVACGMPFTSCDTQADCCSGTTCNFIDSANPTKGKECKTACAQPFNSCLEDSDCCSGSTCNPVDVLDPTKGKTCKVVCAQLGNTCLSNADCCSGSTCGYIDPKDPKKGAVCKSACEAPGTACTSDGECCSGSTCDPIDAHDLTKGKACTVACGLTNSTCLSGGDCCTGSTCNWVDSTNASKGEQCKVACGIAASACTTNADCCNGNVCLGGACTPSCVIGCSGSAPSCNPETNTCAACNQSANDLGVCPALKQICTGTSCTACSGNTPVFDNNTCVQCDATHTGLCTGATPLCDATTNSCVACSAVEGSPLACPSPFLCEADGSCAQCDETHLSACKDTTPVCDSAIHACAACSATLACPPNFLCQTDGRCLASPIAAVTITFPPPAVIPIGWTGTVAAVALDKMNKAYLAPLTWTWTDSCGGTFEDTHAAATKYTAPTLAHTSCVLTARAAAADSSTQQASANFSVISLTLSANPAAVNVGDTRTLTATFDGLPSGAPVPVLSWYPPSGCGGTIDGSGLSATYMPPTTISASAAIPFVSCTEKLSAQYLGMAGPVPPFEMKSNVRLTLGSTAFSVPPGKTSAQALMATAIGGHIPADFSWKVTATSGGGCTLANPQMGTTSASADVVAPTTEGSCTVSATSPLIGFSATIEITVRNFVLSIDLPANGATWVIRDSNDPSSPNYFLTISGKVGPVTTLKSLAITGSASGSALIDKTKTDASGTAPWSFTMNSATPIPLGDDTFTATALWPDAKDPINNPPTKQTATLAKVYVFGAPDKAPTMTSPKDGAVFFTTDTVKLSATASDNAKNPTDDPNLAAGIANVWFYGTTSQLAAQQNGSSWDNNLSGSNLGRGKYEINARSMNHGAAYSPYSTGIKFTVVQAPSILITAPMIGDLYESGKVLTLTAVVTDPDNLVQSVQFFNYGKLLGTATGAGAYYTLPITLKVTGGDPYYLVTTVASYKDPANPGSLITVAGQSVNFTVVNPPTIDQAAGASPNPVLGLTTKLTVSATSFLSNSLSYQWSDDGHSPAPATLDFNGAGKQLNVTFTKAGTYNFHADIKDTLGGKVTSSTAVVVIPALQVTPPGPTYVVTNGTLQFVLTGKDQFGNGLPTTGAIVWSTTCSATIGSINAATGLFTAKTQQGGPCAVNAANNGHIGTTSVIVTNHIPPVVSINSMTSNTGAFKAPLDITLLAQASDVEAKITKVQFLANDQLIGAAVKASPYSFKWASVMPGNYYVSAAATDALGATTTSYALSLVVQKPTPTITSMTPNVATTGDYSAGTVVEINGYGIAGPDGLLPQAQLLWQGSPRQSVYAASNYVYGKLLFNMKANEFDNPGSFTVQFRNPDGLLSNFMSFVIDGKPIVRCLDVTNQGRCPTSAVAHALSATPATSETSINPRLTRKGEVTAVTENTGGGIQWSVVSGLMTPNTNAQAMDFRATQNVIFTSEIIPGVTFNLTQLPMNMPAGDYTLVAEGVNLAGRMSVPASTHFYLMADDISTVRVFPNPWRSDLYGDDKLLTFNGLPNGTCTLKIFTVSGHWIKTLSSSSGQIQWDLKNDSGEKVQSGLYLYVVTDTHNGKVRGKFSVIR